MKTRKMAAGAVLSLGVIALVGPLSTSPAVPAQDNANSDEEQLVRIGYAIAPVATSGFPYAGPVIVSRNLTPDQNGGAEAGHTFADFRDILRTGKDFDNIHPTCQSDTAPKIVLGVCIPPPVDGSKLQVMPWPVFHNMTDHQIAAIYEYLGAIPCIDNTFSPPPAGAPTSYAMIAVAMMRALGRAMLRRRHVGPAGTNGSYE